MKEAEPQRGQKNPHTDLFNFLSFPSTRGYIRLLVVNNMRINLLLLVVCFGLTVTNINREIPIFCFVFVENDLLFFEVVSLCSQNISDSLH